MASGRGDLLMRKEIEKIAATDHTILITGRTGTGKSHLAQQIHNRSPRKEQKFVSVNLATLSETLIESELFGHEKGSFSGADAKRIGKLESANGGTIFLDEIGELSPKLQTKLLDALNNQMISPVGSNREIQLNIRIITATNRNLETMVQKGEFREDLFYRINTFQVHLENLKETKERIIQMAKQFIAKASEDQNIQVNRIDDSFLSFLKQYNWPGNIRELKNVTEFAVAMSEGGEVNLSCLPPYLKGESSKMHHLSRSLDFKFPIDYREAKTQFEKSYLHEVLALNCGMINLTARKSGMSKVTLIDKIRRYEIDVATIRYQSHLKQKTKEDV